MRHSQARTEHMAANAIIVDAQDMEHPGGGTTGPDYRFRDSKGRSLAILLERLQFRFPSNTGDTQVATVHVTL